LSTRATKRKIPRRGTGGFLFAKAQKDSLTIFWALLTALLSTLLATTALLTALASRCLILLTWFLLTTLLAALLTPLLAALAALAALLLPTHFFVSHGAILLRGRISAGGQSPRDIVGSLSDKWRW
jgi:hypothetical protein